MICTVKNNLLTALGRLFAFYTYQLEKYLTAFLKICRPGPAFGKASP